MNGADVRELVAAILDRWPHCRDKVHVAQYERDLAGVVPEHAVVAVETWYRDGERFAPSGADILGRVADLALDIPAWGAVTAELHRVHSDARGRSWTDGRTCPLGQCDGRGIVADDEARTSRYCACREQMRAEQAALQAVHPIVAEFIATVGQRELAGVLDGDRTAEAQVREKWLAFARNVRRQVTYHGIPDHGLPGMRRLAIESAQRMPEIASSNGRRGRRHLRSVSESIADLAGPAGTEDVA
jgi:hypothetical protein